MVMTIRLPSFRTVSDVAKSTTGKVVHMASVFAPVYLANQALGIMTNESAFFTVLCRPVGDRGNISRGFTGTRQGRFRVSLVRLDEKNVSSEIYF